MKNKLNPTRIKRITVDFQILKLNIIITIHNQILTCHSIYNYVSTEFFYIFVFIVFFEIITNNEFFVPVFSGVWSAKGWCPIVRIETEVPVKLDCYGFNRSLNSTERSANFTDNNCMDAVGTLHVALNCSVMCFFD